MSFKALATTAFNRVGRQVLTVQKHSPVLLFGAGIVGVVAGVVLASRATLKLDEVLEKTQYDIELAKNTVHADYSDTDRQKDLVLLYLKAGVDVTKLYAPAIAVLGVSIAALTGSHVILTRRNTAMVAAYAALDRGFKEYRKRVIDKVGVDKERDLQYGLVSEEISETDEDGKVVKKKIKRLDGRNSSIYARFFDQNTKNWNRERSYNQMFIQCQQNYANDRLHAMGHVFLNEVYDMLGLERSREGAVVGWVKNNKDGGDNRIDFGVFQGDQWMGTLFVNGDENSILLDFNVDGVIWDKI